MEFWSSLNYHFLMYLTSYDSNMCKEVVDCIYKAILKRHFSHNQTDSLQLLVKRQGRRDKWCLCDRRCTAQCGETNWDRKQVSSVASLA